MFQTIPTYDKYRALYLNPILFRGEDVYALQTGVNALGFITGGFDGIYGKQTDAAVRSAQRKLNIAVDGRVGPQTWEHLTDELAIPERVRQNLPYGLLHGQLNHESGFRGGMYSTPPREDKSFDAGVAQENSALHSLADAFHMPKAITLIAAKTREFFDWFHGVSNLWRRWSLAAGAWNAPYFAAWLAWEAGATHIGAGSRLKPSDAARAKLETYMASVTAYLQL